MKKKKPAVSKKKMPRVFGFSLTFFRDNSLRRLFASIGIHPRLGWPSSDDQVLVWGRASTASRGMAIAARTGASVLTVEDGFLRSVKTGRQGGTSLSVILDRQGIYFETGLPSDLFDILNDMPSLSEEDASAARAGIAFLKQHHLSKYNDFPISQPDVPDDFVLVIDQTFRDASITGADADAGAFQTMLEAALAEHPDATVLVKTHPETGAGKRRGYFDKDDAEGRVVFFDQKVCPWILLDKAQAVYCVSSQLGMEAIFAGHVPVMFGNAFYCGIGLTDDRHPHSIRKKQRSVEQLFQGVYQRYCRWYDPYFDRESDFKTAARNLTVLADAARECQRPQVFVGMRLWKRGLLKRYFAGTPKAPLFFDDAKQAVKAASRDGADVLVWAGKETAELAQGCASAGVRLQRVEDGFLRSSGLGAQLIEPVSLAFDDLGIYYDPTRESRLERLISTAENLPQDALERANKVWETIVSLRLSKYNLKTNAALDLPEGRHCILVPGQVENDQSILKGAGLVKTNLDLLKATREQFPDGFLIFKHHPDVAAGLRDGGAPASLIAEIADMVAQDVDITNLIDQVSTVATVTSLTGFEALLRGKEVICFGAPFYAGWGLTNDLGPIPERRRARPSLPALIHATLVDYPRYWDPVSGLPCPIEVVLERFERKEVFGDRRRSIRILAKVQGVFASYAHLWR